MRLCIVSFHLLVMVMVIVVLVAMVMVIVLLVAVVMIIVVVCEMVVVAGSVTVNPSHRAIKGVLLIGSCNTGIKNSSCERIYCRKLAQRENYHCSRSYL